MYRKIGLFVFGTILAGVASAHQFVPTYPELRPSFIEGVMVADLELFNKRENVEWYQIDVFDQNWNPISFATSEKIFNVPYLKRKKFQVFVREKDAESATYVCTRSRLRKNDFQDSGIASRICSKFK